MSKTRFGKPERPTPATKRSRRESSRLCSLQILKPAEPSYRDFEIFAAGVAQQFGCFRTKSRPKRIFNQDDFPFVGEPRKLIPVDVPGLAAGRKSYLLLGKISNGVAPSVPQANVTRLKFALQIVRIYIAPLPVPDDLIDFRNLPGRIKPTLFRVGQRCKGEVGVDHAACKRSEERRVGKECRS